jgi:hypothetical protein
MPSPHGPTPPAARSRSMEPVHIEAIEDQHQPVAQRRGVADAGQSQPGPPRMRSLVRSRRARTSGAALSDKRRLPLVNDAAQMFGSFAVGGNPALGVVLDEDLWPVALALGATMLTLKPASRSSLEVNFRRARMEPSKAASVSLPRRLVASRRWADVTAILAQRSLRPSWRPMAA